MPWHFKNKEGVRLVPENSIRATIYKERLDQDTIPDTPSKRHLHITECIEMHCNS